jgi:hypothetical protein
MGQRFGTTGLKTKRLLGSFRNWTSILIAGQVQLMLGFEAGLRAKIMSAIQTADLQRFLD